MSKRKNLNRVTECQDKEVWPHIEQLMNAQTCSESQSHISHSNEPNNSANTMTEQNDDELGNIIIMNN